VWSRVARLAGRQHGVISRSQLVELGAAKDAIRRWVAEERLYRLHRGVYAVGHEALTPKSRFIAAVYACGPGSLLSHRAAGALQGLLDATAVIEVTAPRGCKPKPGIVIHRSRHVHPDDRGEVDSIPTTSVARTLVDLADVLNERQLTRAVRQAELLKIFDLRAIEAALERLPGRKGRHRLLRSKAERGSSSSASATTFPSRSSTSKSPATRWTCTGPKPGSCSNSTARPRTTRDTPSTRTAAAIALWRSRESRH
jgi:hypothetical protein